MLVAGGGEKMPSENSMKMEIYQSIVKRQRMQLKMDKTPRHTLHARTYLRQTLYAMASKGK